MDPRLLFQVFIRKEKKKRSVEKMALERYPNGYFKMRYGTALFQRKELLVDAVPRKAMVDDVDDEVGEFDFGIDLEDDANDIEDWLAQVYDSDMDADDEMEVGDDDEMETDSQ